MLALSTELNFTLYELSQLKLFFGGNHHATIHLQL